MKKKIVIMSEALGGGVRRHIIDLIENLSKDKFEIYFMYNLDRADDIIKKQIDYMREVGIKLIEIEGFNRKISVNDIKAFISIYKELKKINPDIVHCHSSKAGAIGRVAAKLLGVKSIYYTPHAYYFQNPNSSNLKKRIYAIIESILSKGFTTKTINVSKGEKEIALSYKLDKEDKFCVIYNGIEDYKSVDKELNIKLRKEFNINPNDIVIGVIARLNEQKDPDTFVDIAKAVLEKYDNVKFLYVGDGDLFRHINERLSCEGLNKNIILTGFRKDTDEILNIFDIFLTTALYEGMPYALIEALRAKLPIVATNTTGNNEVVDNGINGYLINIQDSYDGFNKIDYLIKNRSKIDKLALESHRKYSMEFTLDNMILEYETLYNSI
nr:glycosyltransferase family 4 protein [uncultured Romboutsia sp.]